MGLSYLRIGAVAINQGQACGYLARPWKLLQKLRFHSLSPIRYLMGNFYSF